MNIPAILLPILDSVSLAPSEREAIASSLLRAHWYHPGAAYDIDVDHHAAPGLRDRLHAIHDSTQLRALEACVRVLLDERRAAVPAAGDYSIGIVGDYPADDLDPRDEATALGYIVNGMASAWIEGAK